MNTLPASFDAKAAFKSSGIDVTHPFTDANGGQDQVSFDLSVENFTRTNSVGDIIHYTTASTDSFDFKVDGNIVFHTTAADIHNAVGDNTMQHINFLIDVGAPGDHTLELVYTHQPEAAPAAPPAGAPIEERIGIGVDSIHVHDWIV